MTTNFDDDNHSVRTGILFGHLVKNGVGANMRVDSEGKYLPTIQILVDMGEECPLLVDVVVQ